LVSSLNADIHAHVGLSMKHTRHVGPSSIHSHQPGPVSLLPVIHNGYGSIALFKEVMPP